MTPQRLRGALAAPLLAIGLAFGLSAPAAADSVYETLSSDDRYSTLVAAIDAAGLQGALSNDEASLTVFAPSNQAFSAIPEKVLTGLLADTEALTSLLTYHVVGEEIRYRDFEDGTLASLQGADIEIDVTRYGWWWSKVDVNDARIRRANVNADNGVIHEIDKVLDPSFMSPPTILEIAAADPDNFSTLAELAELAGLTRTLDNEHYTLTLFAPTNAAFAEVPQALVEQLKSDPPSAASGFALPPRAWRLPQL